MKKKCNRKINKAELKKNLERFGNDTVVQCTKCGHREYLSFANGLRNGWSKCCGYTMPIIYHIANIEEAVTKTINSQVPLKKLKKMMK